MQTFLPYPDYRECARVLDNARLRNQLNECYVLYESIGTRDKPAWRYHPCRLMWFPYREKFLTYALAIADELIRRDIRNTLIGYFYGERHTDNGALPVFIGDERVHSSHRAALLHKKPLHYKQFGWSEMPSLEYWWPVTSHNKTLVINDYERYGSVYGGPKQMELW